MSVYPIILSQMNFTHRDNLTYPYEERGLQFGDGVYEVIRIYNGQYHLFEKHVNRLFRSAEAIKLKLPFTKEEVSNRLLELLEKNEMTKDGKVYLQVTRGSITRTHAFPVEDVTANFYAYIEDQPRPLALLNNGVKTITQPDLRWKLCHIKSLNLLPNVLAKQAAHENDCFEAILHLDGVVTEGSSANVFLFKDGKIYTHPATERVLKGCVRMLVERLANELDIPFVEETFTIDDIKLADELFLTSSTSEVMPIVKVDDEKIANGSPGPITRQLQKAYEADAQITADTIKATI